MQFREQHNGRAHRAVRGGDLHVREPGPVHALLLRGVGLCGEVRGVVWVGVAGERRWGGGFVVRGGDGGEVGSEVQPERGDGAALEEEAC